MPALLTCAPTVLSDRKMRKMNERFSHRQTWNLFKNMPSHHPCALPSVIYLVIGHSPPIKTLFAGRTRSEKHLLNSERRWSKASSPEGITPKNIGLTSRHLRQNPSSPEGTDLKTFE